MNNLSLKPKFAGECIKNYNKLPKKYLGIHIRNTDHKCDYIDLYIKNKTLIHSYDTIYIATDDKDSLQFFKNKNLNIINFTTFPEKKYYNLHYNMSIEPHTKFIDMFTDILILSQCEELITNSNGYFIKLIIDCHKNKTKFLQKFTT